MLLQLWYVQFYVGGFRIFFTWKKSFLYGEVKIKIPPKNVQIIQNIVLNLTA